jgi:hypothetical protein
MFWFDPQPEAQASNGGPASEMHLHLRQRVKRSNASFMPAPRNISA